MVKNKWMFLILGANKMTNNHHPYIRTSGTVDPYIRIKLIVKTERVLLLGPFLFQSCCVFLLEMMRDGMRSQVLLLQVLV